MLMLNHYKQLHQEEVNQVDFLGYTLAGPRNLDRKEREEKEKEVEPRQAREEEKTRKEKQEKERRTKQRREVEEKEKEARKQIEHSGHDLLPLTITGEVYRAQPISLCGLCGFHQSI